MQKLTSISLSPNVFPEDIAAAKEMLREPQYLREGPYIDKLTNAFLLNFGSPTSNIAAFSFNSGRSALLTLLQAAGIGKGDEVLIQAFTCNAVPNPVLWLDAKPVYVDVNEETFNMDAKDLEKKITACSKAIIIQHTFGLAADMEKILPIARKHNLFVIEDCAHALGSTYHGKKVGIFGDAAFFSFGRDKVISSVYGGLALIKDANSAVAKKMVAFYGALPLPSSQWVKQQLRHPITLDKLLRWYNVPFPNRGIGKFLLRASQLTVFLSKAVHWKEKQGLKPDYFPARLPNALAYLALKQFERLNEFNAHRRVLVEYYYHELRNLKPITYKLKAPQEGHSYLRYPIRHPRAHEIIKRARAEAILLGDWYDSVVAPRDTDLEKMFYQKGSCPVAERLARETFNLPTNPNVSLGDAKRVVEFLESLPL